MASYPGAKVHRPSRRSLGKGQSTDIPFVGVTVTSTGSTATLTFQQPVVVNGNIPLGVSGGLTLTTQTVVSQTVVTQLYSGALSGKTYALPAGTQTVKTMIGGLCSGASGTF